MKIQKQTNKSKKILFISIASLLLVGVLLVFAWKYQQSNETAEGSATTSKQKADETGSESGTTNNPPKSSETNNESIVEKEKDKVLEYEGTSPDSSPTLTGSINYSAVAGNNLIIRTTINQIVSSGTCDLTLSNGTKNVTRSSAIAQNPSSSTCQGFDVPVAELSTGTWSIDIKISGDGKVGNLTGSSKI